MKLDALRNLPMSPEMKTYLVNALEWLENPNLYEAALKDPTSPSPNLRQRAPAFTPAELDQMRDRKFSPLLTQERTFPVFGFPVTQLKPAGKVARPVWHPAINEAISDACLQPLHLPSRERILSDSTPSAPGPQIQVQLDAISCYDQRLH